MTIVPIRLKQARVFVNMHHRHNVASIQSVFNVGLADDGKLIGVAMVGLPKSRMLAEDEYLLEVTRVCVLEGNQNANSMLYGACARAAKALGYTQLVTYTLLAESGSSLRAAGWIRDEEPRESNVENWRTNNGDKRTVDLFGNHLLPQGPKWRWWKKL